MDVRATVFAISVVVLTVSERPVCAIVTRRIVCNFQGDFCGYKQDTSDDFDWSLAHEETSTSLQQTNHEQNYYISACRNSTKLRPRKLARLASPVYEVTTPSLLSLQFKKFKTENDGSRLRVQIRSTTRSKLLEQPFFLPLPGSKSELSWVILESKMDILVPFQLVIEAQVGYSAKSCSAVDDIILTLYSYPVDPKGAANESPGITPSEDHQGSDLPSWSGPGPGPGPLPDSEQVIHSNGANKQQKTESADGGVSPCFAVALTSSSLLVIGIVIVVVVVLSLSTRKSRYRRFTFGHDYEEIKNKESYNKSKSVSAIALMKERPQLRLTYPNHQTASSRMQRSLSSCLSKVSMRDSVRSSIYAEITEADFELDPDLLTMDPADLSDDAGFGNSTTLTTICTGEMWDIISGTSSIKTSVNDFTLRGASDVMMSSFQKLYPTSFSSQNDSGWVENIIYERTPDFSSFDSIEDTFTKDRYVNRFEGGKIQFGIKTRHRMHTM